MAKEIQKLTSRHRKIMYSLCEGMKPCEISTIYGITESRLSILQRSQIWRDEVKLIREGMLENHRVRAQGMLTAAQNVVEASMDSDNERIALDAAKDVQNRTGLIYEPKVEAGTAQIRIILGD